MKINKRVIVVNFLWRFLERSGVQLITFVVSIILARLLEPSDYGTVALITVLITILNVFIDSGFANALIQKKDADDLDFSSVFFANIIFCFVIYFGVFICAPSIAKFYNNPEMTSMIRVLGINLVISGVKNVQSAYISRNLAFKKFFFATLFGTIFSAIVGIYMALSGFGCWAIIVQSISNNFIDTVILWVTVEWHPKKIFSFPRLMILFSYGWKMLVSGLLGTFYNNLRSLILGKVYTASDLAFYNRGENWPSLLTSNINSAIDSVLFPVMSNAQDNQDDLKNMTSRSLKIGLFFLAPMMIGLAAIGEPIVRIVFTEKWLPCVWYMRIFCVAFMLHPIDATNLNAIQALGRSDIVLKLQIIKKIVGIVLLIPSVFLGTKAIAISAFLTSITSIIINIIPNKKLLHYGVIDQLKDIIPTISISIVMGIMVFLIPVLGYSDILTVVLQILTGITVYFVLMYVLKIDSLRYILKIAKKD